MANEPNAQLRQGARRALERSLAPVAPPPDGPSDPELFARIEAALLSLPRRRRAIFLAVRLDGASYTEVAERSGPFSKRVEREVARAIAHIDRCLEQREVAPPHPWWRCWFG